MEYPAIYNLEELPVARNDNLASVQRNCTLKEIGGKWVPARPLGYPSLRQRLKAAWMVFTGRADAVVWPGGQ